MGAPDLLLQLRSIGLVLTLTSEGRLHVAPREALTDTLRAAIVAERDDLVRALQGEAEVLEASVATQGAKTSSWWLVYFADREPAEMCFSPPACHATVLADYRDAIAASPISASVQKCLHCQHFRQPGLSDGYCTWRDDLPAVYGEMRTLPADDGAGCDDFWDAR